MKAYWLGLTVLGVTVLIAPSQTQACASCTTGDPTLVGFGTELPYENRVRLAFELRSRHDELGRGATAVNLNEIRAEFGVAWAPLNDLFIQLAWPLIYRDVRFADSSVERVIASGDLGLRARWQITRGFALSAGVSLPTAPELTRREANATVVLPLEVQPGTDSIDPSLGFSLFHSEGPHLIGGSLWGTLPTGDANPSLKVALNYQYEFWRKRRSALSTMAVFEGRLDGKAYEFGEKVPDSGGFIGFLGGDIRYTPEGDWLFSLGIRAPIVQALTGAHEEGFFGVFSIAYDAF